LNFIKDVLINVKTQYEKPDKYDIYGYSWNRTDDLKCDLCGLSENELLNETFITLSSVQDIMICENCAENIFTELEQKLNFSKKPFNINDYDKYFE